jgi:hypothetical protein
MKSLRDAVGLILTRPTPEALIALQGALLATEGHDELVQQALEVAGHFYSYLCELQSKVAARDYSELASRLDIGAVGAVALENLTSGQGEDLWKRLLLGGVGESLMVAASRQYIRAWRVEAGLVHSEATWYLGEALWRASQRMQPDLPVEERRQAIETLLVPARDPDTPASAKALLIGRSFQVLLLSYLDHLLSAVGEGS